jgi:alkanesulfonate monooxygenase SsuD/methylene tetrahydromethanopterin reductase-like flavin-dependent oxidoreductase (luciferase family)
MKFGVFDHLDRNGLPLGEQYRQRLELIEAYEHHGFYCYHIAEHHATPLGMAPSPSVFLAALAQRTKRLKFGPLVYTLPMYHPLRVAEEICMLDHLSNGRLQVGIGRGISPHELEHYGVVPAEAQARYLEAFAIVMQALTQESVIFEGKFYTFRDVPMELAPLQRPHPPLWYGVANVEAIGWVAQNAVNVVCNVPAARAQAIVARYRAEWQAAGRDMAALPLVGFNRHIVVAPTTEEATAIARRAYDVWYASFFRLWERHGTRPSYALYPASFDELEAMGLGVAGSPEKVRDVLAAQVAQAGSNYLVSRLAFGDLSLAESMRSVELYAAAVMPALAGTHQAAE